MPTVVESYIMRCSAHVESPYDIVVGTLFSHAERISQKSHKHKMRNNAPSNQSIPHYKYLRPILFESEVDDLNAPILYAPLYIHSSFGHIATSHISHAALHTVVLARKDI